jgi:hypothetical protein
MIDRIRLIWNTDLNQYRGLLLAIYAADCLLFALIGVVLARAFFGS